MAQPCSPGSRPYTIKAGDTLYNIAKVNNLSLQDIFEANPRVEPNRLQIGQVICIPGPQPPSTCPPGNEPYTIQAGDTFFSLARRFNTNIDALIKANPNVNPNYLSIGQKICIPGTCPGATIPYIIQAGDTYFAIARRYNTTIEDLLELNRGVDPNNLKIGQKICIPRSRSIYSNRQYQVVLLYPSDWKKVSDTRYEGADGFFQISAVKGGTLSEVCFNEANHVLKPYGSNPRIQNVTLQDQPGCLITPSADQPREMKNQAALILKYPKPIQIGNQTYNYFILWADQVHIKEIADTVEFFPM